jgi:hypothetical protein
MPVSSTLNFNSMKLNPSLGKLLAPAYAPCSAFAGNCREMRWNPAQGHVPRGFLGAAGTLKDIELVLVFAEPGDPHDGEIHEGLATAYQYATYAFKTGKDQFHRNVRAILDACWPGAAFDEQMKKVWMMESVLCSATKECGPVSAVAASECGRRYLAAQLELLPRALVVALGRKAQQRLCSISFTKFLPAFAVAPPGCNFPGAQESWDRIPIELRRRNDNLLEEFCQSRNVIQTTV